MKKKLDKNEMSLFYNDEWTCRNMTMSNENGDKHLFIPVPTEFKKLKSVIVVYEKHESEI